MKALHWDKLSSRDTGNTVWDQANAGDVSLDFQQLESLFALKDAPPAKARGSVSARARAVQLIDLKRAHNISIQLTGLRRPFPEIRQALLSMDEGILTAEILGVLDRAVPTDAEVCESAFLDVRRCP